MRSVKHGFGLLLPGGLSLLGAKVFESALDVIYPCELLQRERGNPALVVTVQVEEFAPRMGQEAPGMLAERDSQK